MSGGAVNNFDEYDVFVFDRVEGDTGMASVNALGEQGNDGSEHPAVFSQGKSIVFDSFANNLVLDDQNNRRDIFIQS